MCPMNTKSGRWDRVHIFTFEKLLRYYLDLYIRSMVLWWTSLAFRSLESACRLHNSCSWIRWDRLVQLKKERILIIYSKYITLSKVGSCCQASSILHNHITCNINYIACGNLNIEWVRGLDIYIHILYLQCSTLIRIPHSQARSLISANHSHIQYSWISRLE